MSTTLDKLAKELKTQITSSDNRKPKPYDSQAEVIRVEDGIAWVHIPGGVQETPVRLTLNAKKGDLVNIHVAGGSAWITGNGTNPPTDDTVARVADTKAGRAITIGEMALDDATRAKTMADVAEAEAGRANAAANVATTYANEASAQAQAALLSAQEADAHALEANAYATAAGYQLSEVEKVVDVLTWISQHGTYKRTNDETVIEGKWYFEAVGGSYVVGTPVSNPKTEGFYELDDVDAAISNYISTHLYLDNDGLHVQSDSNQGAHLLINGTSVQLINVYGVPIAQYSNSVILGDANSSHIELSALYGLSFYQTAKIEDGGGVPLNRVAYIQNDRLFIESATLTNSLQIGNFRWVVLDHRISLKYNPIN